MPALSAAVIALIYANTLHSPFVFDDWHALAQNPHIRSLGNLPRFFVDPNTTSVLRENKDLRPLLLATFALNYALSGLRTWSYHAVNLLLHWIAVLLVFRIARDHLWLGPDARPVAMLAALVVAAHPLNTEPVNYLSARSALLTAVFYLGAFDCALRGRTLGACALAAGAMLTKAIALSLPAALLAYWLLAPRGADGRRPTIRWGLLAALGAIASAGIAYRELLLPPWVSETARQSGVTPWRYCMTEWSAYLYYLRLFVWPTALVIDRVDYPFARSFLEPRSWGSLAALVALGALAWRGGRRCPAGRFAVAWYVITLLPESSLFPLAEAVNEHRPYLAMLGLGTLAGLGLWRLAQALAASVPPARRVAASAVLVTAVLGSATAARNRAWHDERTLWLDATRKAPANARAWLNAGVAAMAAGDLVTARQLLLTGHRLLPCYAYIQINLSVLERREGNLGAALAWLDEAERCNPGLALVHYYRGDALRRLGRLDPALAEYRRATAIDAYHTDAWFGTGQLLEHRRAWREAAAAYDRALAADPTRADAAMAAGLIYHYRLGDPRTAVARYRSVLALVPSHYGAHYQLAVALLAEGRRDEAEAAWRAFVPLAEAKGDRATLANAPTPLRQAAR
jgi:tetratricopeptide (TPR) repeat protein